MDDVLLIVLSQTGTCVARFIRLFTRKPYNHASVSLDLSLEEIYSFCRTYRHLPLPATLKATPLHETACTFRIHHRSAKA